MRTTSREEVFRLHAQFCKALSDATRLLIIVELRDGTRTVNEIARAVRQPQSLTSRHLGVLRDKGVVIAEREGSFVRYRLADRRILAAIEMLLDVLASQLARNATHSTLARRIRASARAL